MFSENFTGRDQISSLTITTIHNPTPLNTTKGCIWLDKKILYLDNILIIAKQDEELHCIIAIYDADATPDQNAMTFLCGFEHLRVKIPRNYL
jgi:hypothetical protein